MDNNKGKKDVSQENRSSSGYDKIKVTRVTRVGFINPFPTFMHRVYDVRWVTGSEYHLKGLYSVV